MLLLLRAPPTTSPTRLARRQVKGPNGEEFLSGVKAISSGGHHGLALKNDDTLWAWGRNNWGQLGTGTTTQRNTPVKVSGLSNVQAIGAGHYHSLAVTSSPTDAVPGTPTVVSTIPTAN